MPIWTAEREVDCNLARKLISEQFSQLKPIEILSLGNGWDNTAFLVNQEFVFRFPRRASSVSLLEKEASVLPSLALSLPTPISHPIYFGEPTSRFSWPFLGSRLLPGTTACRRPLNELDQNQLANALAEFLSTLHSLPADEFELPHDEHGTLDVKQRVPKIETNLQYVREHQLIDRHISFDDIFASAEGANFELDDCVVHADLYARHLVINGQNQLVGIIDWGDVHRNDPAVDLAVVFQLLSPGAPRENFWRGYGSSSQSQHHLARFSALDHLLTILRYGHEIADADLLRIGSFGIDRVRFE